MSLLDLILVLALITAFTIAVVTLCLIAGLLLCISPRTRHHALPVILVAPCAAVGGLMGAIITCIAPHIPFRDLIDQLVESGLGLGASIGALIGALFGTIAWLIIHALFRPSKLERNSARATTVN
jgi:hypothetical protein